MTPRELVQAVIDAPDRGSVPHPGLPGLRDRARAALASGNLESVLRELATRRICGGGPCGWMALCVGYPTCLVKRAEALLRENPT